MRTFKGAYENMIERVLGEANLVVTTTINSAVPWLTTYFHPDALIAHNAARTVEEEMQVPFANFPAVERVVMVGDHKQLGPFEHDSRYRNEYGERRSVSMFERLWNYSDFLKVTLIEQRLIHPDVFRYVSNCFYQYDMRMSSAAIEENKYTSVMRKYTKSLRLRHKPLVAYVNLPKSSVTESGTSFENRAEAEYIVAAAGYFLRQEEIDPAQISLCSVYKAQTSLIRELLLCQESLHTHKYTKERAEQVQITTVDSPERKLNQIAIVGTTAVIVEDTHKLSPHLKDPKRTNALLSGAKAGLIVVGNFQGLKSKKGEKPNIIKAIKKIGKKSGCTMGPHDRIPRPRRSKKVQRSKSTKVLSSSKAKVGKREHR